MCSPPSRIDGTSVFQRVRGDPIIEEFLLGPVDRLGGLGFIVPARRAGDPGSNPGPGDNFFS